MRKRFFLFTCIFFSHSFIFCQDYDFMGSNVNVLDAATNDTLYTGRLLIDQIIGNEYIKKVEIRYGADAEILNAQGQLVTVERIMDFYYPSNEIKFLHEGNEILKLPTIVLLHGGQGSRLTVVPQAEELAKRGYTVLVPTYRSDRSLVNYCIGFQHTVYGMVQDLRAVIKHYSKAHDEAMSLSIETIEDLYGTEIADFAIGIQESRSDAQSLMFSGYSGGGVAGYHTTMKISQNQFSDYLSADEPYIVTGDLGDANLGQRGTIDAVGTDFISGVPFPVDRIRGVISRSTGDSEILIDFDSHEQPIPFCLIHGTCDKALPYESMVIESDNPVCDVNITRPDGSQDTAYTVYGSIPIAQGLIDAGTYVEFTTLCGGGHHSNSCIPEVIDERMFDFIQRILQNNYVNGNLVDFVYRFQPENYSTQCCQIGDQYGYIEKCSCEDSNPIEVIDLPYVEMNNCQFNEACILTDYCNLVGVEDFGDAHLYTMMKIIERQNGWELEYSSLKNQETLIEIFNSQGARIYQTSKFSFEGQNHFRIPENISSKQLLIIRVGKRNSIKFLPF